MILLYLVIVMAGVALAGGLFGLASRPKIDDAEVAAIRKREQIAAKALRAIAAGDTMPIITAGDALTNMDATYDNRKALR